MGVSPAEAAAVGCRPLQVFHARGSRREERICHCRLYELFQAGMCQALWSASPLSRIALLSPVVSPICFLSAVEALIPALFTRARRTPWTACELGRESVSWGTCLRVFSCLVVQQFEKPLHELEISPFRSSYSRGFRVEECSLELWRL